MSSADFFASHPVFTHAAYSAARAARGTSSRTADSLLIRHTAAENILHLRRGLYATVPRGTSPATYEVDPYLVATQLAPDAFVAFHAALQFRGRAYSIWHRYAVLSRAHVRPLTFRGNEFVAVRPPRALMARPDLGGGVVTEPYAGGVVRVATFERTLVDLLHDPAQGGGWEELWRSLEMVEFFDLAAVTGHVRMLGSALTAARVGLFLEQHRDELFVEGHHLETLAALAPRQARYLDRTREPGRLVQPWNLIVPERVLTRAWSEVT
jgi:predicted transcriptional regulator of viral defense system